ncbi:MAG: sensor histidine kinase [Planctomycetota bacterium]
MIHQLQWVVVLRWIAVAVIVVGAVTDHLALQWYGALGPMVYVASSLAIFNVMFALVLRTPRPRRPRAVAMGWAQVLVDLSSLTLLGLFTGGAASPILPFFVLHMIFSSLLLSSTTAYSVASITIAMYGGGLWVRDLLPEENMEWMFLAGWAISLMAAVYLTNSITENLRDQRRRLMIQNRRGRVMATQLRSQQYKMIQHEKMVALGQMAAGMAHEIGNPLASMDAVLQLQQRDERYINAENIQALREEVKRIGNLSQQLNTYTRPAHNQREYVSLNGLVEQALRLLRFDHRIRKARLETHLSDVDCRVYVHPHEVQQVLTNILINALDALTETPEPMVTVRTSNVESGGVIEIIDNGIGIDANTLGRIFEPFYTTKPVGEGTGLGLAISYNLISNMDGSIEVASKPGRGSTFRVILPGVPEGDLSSGQDSGGAGAT